MERRRFSERPLSPKSVDSYHQQEPADTGHFALEEDGDVIASHMRRFLSTPSDLCLQRLANTSTDCEEKRDPRQDAT